MGEVCIEARHDSGVYLMCATGKVGGRSRHYIGGSQDIAWRVHRHQKGWGPPFTRAAIAQGYTWKLARAWYVPLQDVWPLEQRLKAVKNASLLCPLCTPNTKRAIDVSVNSDIREGVN